MKKALIFSLLAVSLSYIGCETTRKTSIANAPTKAPEVTQPTPEVTQAQRDSIYLAQQKANMRNRKANIYKNGGLVPADKAVPATKQNPKQ